MTMIERWLQIPATMADGAGTDPTPDPEPWDTADTRPSAGEVAGTFPGDNLEGMHLQSGPADVDPPTARTRRTVARAERPDVWRAGSTTITPDQQPIRLLTSNPLRESVLLSNGDTAVSVMLAPSQSDCLSPHSARTLGPGVAVIYGHTAELWVGPVPGAAAAILVSFDEQSYSDAL